MDKELRQAQRQADGIKELRLLMRMGVLCKTDVELMAHLGDKDADVLYPSFAYHCKPLYCIGHFVHGIKPPWAIREAKIAAQKLLVGDLKVIHDQMGWNRPGENSLWLRLHNEKDLLAAMIDGEDHLDLAKILISVSDDLCTHPSVPKDTEVIAHVTKALLETLCSSTT